MINLLIPTPDAMAEFGALVGSHLTAGDLVALNGELGAGKTTFTRGLGHELGVRGTVTSPTFVLARTHPRIIGAPLVHVDAYRLDGPRDVEDLDIDFDASIVVVEWAAGMVDGISESWLEITIERPRGGTADDDDGAAAGDTVEPRTVQIRGFGPRWARLDWLKQSAWRV
jgi:tRNA threonylcarbamoyl adenosine modification protein YjeE